MTKSTRPRAFIFDLDGVITDTANLHFVAWHDLAASVGVEFDAVFNERLKGVSRMDSLELILICSDRHFTLTEKQQLADRKNAHYVRLIHTITPADLLPGALAALESARADGCRVPRARTQRTCWRSWASPRRSTTSSTPTTSHAANPNPKSF